MKQEKNMLQTKEQGKNLEDQINEDEIGNLPEKEFRIMIVKMIQISETEWSKYKKHLTRL